MQRVSASSRASAWAPLAAAAITTTASTSNRSLIPHPLAMRYGVLRWTFQPRTLTVTCPPRTRPGFVLVFGTFWSCPRFRSIWSDSFQGPRAWASACPEGRGGAEASGSRRGTVANERENLHKKWTRNGGKRMSAGTLTQPGPVFGEQVTIWAPIGMSA